VDRIVKERLVGAAVLMAAAIILIPEMLSGPDRSHAEPAAAQSRNDTPIKTYTIDLSHASNAQRPEPVIENRAPPPEEPAITQPTPAQPDATPPTAAQPVPDDQAKPEAPQPSVVEAPTAVAPARAPQPPLASDDAAPTSGRWAVQVGTFSKEANAQRLAKQLRDQGRSAFVMPVKSGSTTLYRVRIGPMKDRASAEAALRDVRISGAKVVPHP
jgi:DedD protein